MAPSPAGALGSRGGRGARDRIVRAAVQLFRAQGIRATGISELVALAQVSRRTLYQHFPGKDDLVLAYLRTFESDPALGPEGALDRPGLTARARLLELFASLADEPRPLRGCPFATAAIEFPDPRDPVHRLAAAHKRRFADRLTELAVEAGARPAEPLGLRLALLYDGACAQGVALDDPAPATEAFALAAALLDAAIE